MNSNALTDGIVVRGRERRRSCLTQCDATYQVIPTTGTCVGCHEIVLSQHARQPRVVNCKLAVVACRTPLIADQGQPADGGGDMRLAGERNRHPGAIESVSERGVLGERVEIHLSATVRNVFHRRVCHQSEKMRHGSPPHSSGRAGHWLVQYTHLSTLIKSTWKSRASVFASRLS